VIRHQRSRPVGAVQVLVLAIAAFATLAFCGCAALQSRETFVVCQVADAATTWYAIAHGAVEASPLLPGSIAGILLIKAGIIWLGLSEWDKIERDGTGGIINVLSCLPVPNNVRVIQRLP
jgi:hypothetical protein